MTNSNTPSVAPRPGADLSCLRQYTRAGPRGRSNAEERSLYGSSADASQNWFAIKANRTKSKKNVRVQGVVICSLQIFSILLLFVPVARVQGVFIMILPRFSLSPGYRVVCS